jgi:hypothetical protein
MWAFVFLFLTAAVAVAQIPRSAVGTIVERMEQAALENRTHYRPYIVTREYRMYGSDAQQPKSEVTAEVSFVPPGRKGFRITDSNGSLRGESIVKHILEDESKAATTGNTSGAIARENYNFQLLGEEALNGSDCFVLALSPKRQDKSLVAGKAWVDKSSYLVRRVDGEMAKMPSWWLKTVHVTVDFDLVDGMWLQERTRAVADVRMVGRHVLTSQAVRFQSGGVEARELGAGPKPTETKDRHPFGRSESIIGVSVVQH